MDYPSLKTYNKDHIKNSSVLAKNLRPTHTGYYLHLSIT